MIDTIFYQYSKTNEKHFLCSVYYELRASTCFEHLVAHHQEALLIQQLVYFVRIISAGCYQGWSGTPTVVATNRHNTHAIYQLLFVQRLLKMSK
jgi:hypothetical protein